MTMTVTVTEARADLPRLLDAVEEGEDVSITRHGREVAVLMSPQQRNRQRAAAAYELADQLRRDLERDAAVPLDDLPGLTIDEAEDLVAHIRRERDGGGRGAR